MTIVYDRTKTVVRRHVAPGEGSLPHPEAVGFGRHHDFDVLAACRSTGKGRGKAPQGRAQIHRTHRGQS